MISKFFNPSGKLNVNEYDPVGTLSTTNSKALLGLTVHVRSLLVLLMVKVVCNK